MIDIDHFKSIDDQYGHRIGDLALRTVARVLQKQCRAEDVLCRYGGEEFVLLTPGVETRGAAIAADRMRKAIESEWFSVGDAKIKLTASFGVGRLGQDVHSATAAADDALYAASMRGAIGSAARQR